MNTEWVTDRIPDEIADGFFVYGELGQLVHWSDVRKGEPWKPIPKCKPYVKPKQYVACVYGHEWGVFRKTNVADKVVLGICASSIKTREAAERIAEIYNEVDE